MRYKRSPLMEERLADNRQRILLAARKLVAAGGFRAAAEFTLIGTYLATLPGFPPARGQPFRMAAGLFFDIDDEGLISRVTVCCDPARLSAALRAD